jgi:hypothetical protein
VTNHFSQIDHVDFGTLIAAMPAMLRFTPTDSLIVVGFTGTGLYRVTFALRVDLPEPGDHAPLQSYYPSAARRTGSHRRRRRCQQRQ